MKKFFTHLLSVIFLLFVVGNGYFVDYGVKTLSKDFGNSQKTFSLKKVQKTSDNQSISQISLEEESEDINHNDSFNFYAIKNLSPFIRLAFNSLFSKTETSLYNGVSSQLHSQKTYILIQSFRI